MSEENADHRLFLHQAYMRAQKMADASPTRWNTRPKFRPKPRDTEGADQDASSSRTQMPAPFEEAAAIPKDYQGWLPPPGVARSREGTGKSPRDPRLLGAVLRTTARKMAWEEPLSLGLVSGHWPQIVGENIAQHTKIEALDQQKLYVRADSTAWARQLQILLPHIERRLEQELGPGRVQQVIVHGPNRPSWKHGRYRVPGPGPRDTYG